jgi:hypothetical protein
LKTGGAEGEWESKNGGIDGEKMEKEDKDAATTMGQGRREKGIVNRKRNH